MSNISFWKQWAQYRKQGRLQAPLLVLGHRPSNVQELSFLLEVATSFSLLHSLPLQSLPSPFKSTLLSSSVDVETLKLTLNQIYIQSLIGMHYQLSGETNREAHLQRARAIQIEVLQKLLKKQKIAVNGQTHESFFLLFLGVCFDLHCRAKKVTESLQVIRDWWTCRKWCGECLNHQSFDLLVLWAYFEQKNHMQWLQDSPTIIEKMVRIWFKQLQISLSRQKKITESTLNSIDKQARQLSRLLQLKSNKSSHIYLKQIKQNLLKRYITHKQSNLFATLFTVLQSIALQTDITIFTYTDVIENEQLFYSSLFDLQRKDNLQLFPKFHAFMRDQSVFSVLKINLTISFQLQKIQPSQKSIRYGLQNKDLSLMSEFLIRPLETSKAVLQYFLQFSGVKITEAKKKVSRAINKKMTVSEPLLFMLVLKKCWQDKFGYQILGISLWITFQAYCKQLCQRKDIPQKDVQQYVKKLKLTLCLYLLGLKYPVKMLQYLPQEGDFINQFVLNPVIPALLLQAGYFFKQFNRDLLVIRQKTETSVQTDSLPWANKVLLYNNIPAILHNHKGYQFYAEALSFVASSNSKSYAQIIIKSLTFVLQGLGSDRKQSLCYVNPQKLQQIKSLLTKLSKMEDKIGLNALQLLKLISDNE